MIVIVMNVEVGWGLFSIGLRLNGWIALALFDCVFTLVSEPFTGLNAAYLSAKKVLVQVVVMPKQPHRSIADIDDGRGVSALNTATELLVYTLAGYRN